jgi:hypothetical protein
MNGKSFQRACALCLALGFNAQRAQGQALDLLIDQKLKNTSPFTQFATFYGHDNCQLFIETAKEDRQVVLERFEETDLLGTYIYLSSQYRLEVQIRKSATGMEIVRIYRIKPLEE